MSNDAPPRRPETTVPIGRPADYRFIDPSWMGAISPERAGEGRAVEGGVAFAGRIFAFAAGSPFPRDAALRVWFDPVASTLLACEARLHGAWREGIQARDETARRAADGARAAADLARTAAREARTAAARDWLDRFSPPFRWVPGTKPVISGLLERSRGDGTNRSSVVHVMLVEPYATGRIRRRAGEMLCAPGTGRNGNVAAGMADDPAAGCPDCPRCLAAADRFLRPAATVVAGPEPEAGDDVGPAVPGR